MRRWIIVALALLVAVPAFAQVGFIKDGQKDYNQLFLKIGGVLPSDSVATRLYVDHDGIVHMTESYPDAFQTSGTTIMSGVATSNNYKSYTAVSSPYTAGSIQGYKWVVVTTSGGTAASPWRVQFLGSDDGVTYSYLTYGTPGGWTDSDTLSVRGHGAGTWRWPLHGIGAVPVVPKFIECRGVNDTAAAAVTFTVSVVGRQH